MDLCEQAERGDLICASESRDGGWVSMRERREGAGLYVGEERGLGLCKREGEERWVVQIWKTVYGKKFRKSFSIFLH